MDLYKCITTSEFQKDYISGVMKNVSIDILKPYISERFVKIRISSKTYCGSSFKRPKKNI